MKRRPLNLEPRPAPAWGLALSVLVILGVVLFAPNGKQHERAFNEHLAQSHSLDRVAN
jgi:hypothetical protein